MEHALDLAGPQTKEIFLGMRQGIFLRNSDAHSTLRRFHNKGFRVSVVGGAALGASPIDWSGAEFLLAQRTIVEEEVPKAVKRVEPRANVKWAKMPPPGERLLYTFDEDGKY